MGRSKNCITLNRLYQNNNSSWVREIFQQKTNKNNNNNNARTIWIGTHHQPHPTSDAAQNKTTATRLQIPTSRQSRGQSKQTRLKNHGTRQSQSFRASQLLEKIR